jgi:predicted dienelactone hydrolase
MRATLTLLGIAALAGAAMQAADPGPLATEILEFPELTDAARQGRKVPIKAHLPRGAGPFPLVVMSHGAGGDWDTHHGQAQHLASHGYAVLCLEHVGSNRARLTAGGRLMRNLDAMIRDADEVLARPRDVSFALDRAEEWNRGHASMRGRLDLGRAGVMGHSFGAFTAMVSCGMRPALDWLTPRVEPGKGLGPDLSDRRVRCGVALSPQGEGEPFFLRQSFASLRVPLLGITGSEDRQQNGLGAENRRAAFASWPQGQHRLVWINGARHLDFTDPRGPGRRIGPTRGKEEVQAPTRAATLLFLDAHLRGDTTAARRLDAATLGAAAGGAAGTIEVLAR